MMDNRNGKPKKSCAELVEMLCIDKGVSFVHMNKHDAETHLSIKNNYLRTSAYRKNYDKYQESEKSGLTGKYKHLDFAYLVELSRIDTQLRYLIMAMCLDIEHDMRVDLTTAIEKNPNEDGYTIAHDFLRTNPRIMKSIEDKANSTFCGQLIANYFELAEVFEIPTSSEAISRLRTRIKRMDCPAWVLLEIISFGDLINFYQFYNEKHNIVGIDKSLLSAVKSIRNAAAHNNCIINDLKKQNTKTPQDMLKRISQIPGIGNALRQNRLSVRAIFEFVSLLVLYDCCARGSARKTHVAQLKQLFFGRIMEHKDYFIENDVLVSSYRFVAQIIGYIFDKEI